MNVLRVLDAKSITKHIVLLIFCSKSCIFSVNPCAFLRQTHFFFTGSTIYGKNCKKEQFCFIFLAFICLGRFAEAFGKGPGAGAFATA